MNPNDNRNRPPSRQSGDQQQHYSQGTPQNRPPQSRPTQSRPPQQGRPPQNGRNAQDDVMKKSYMEYRQQSYRRKKFKTIAGFVLSITIIIALIIVINTSCSGSDKKDGEQTSQSSTVSTVVSEESLTASEGSGQTSGNEVSAQDSDASKEASDQPMAKPVYSNPHKYKVNYNRLSQAVQDELDYTLTTSYVAIYDVTADEIIYSKDLNKKIYPASTTKMLTAITASRIIDPKTVITVGDEINMCNWESSKAYIEEGMQLTFEALLDALLLPSGNDAAYTIAVNAGRIYKNDKTLSNEDAVKVFMELVNDCAQQIGAKDTHYVTPDGWHDDDHYTSAHDLAVIGDYAKSIPIVSKSCSKSYAEWELVNGGTISWSNSNKLIIEGSGYYSKYSDGLKTGFTDEAGTSVVASATMEGHTFVVVAMNGYTLYTKYADCNTMFRKAFALYGLEFTAEDDNAVYDYE